MLHQKIPKFMIKIADANDLQFLETNFVLFACLHLIQPEILDSNDRCECKREHERRRWIEMDEMGKDDDYDE